MNFSHKFSEKHLNNVVYLKEDRRDSYNERYCNRKGRGSQKRLRESKLDNEFLRAVSVDNLYTEISHKIDLRCNVDLNNNSSEKTLAMDLLNLGWSQNSQTNDMDMNFDEFSGETTVRIGMFNYTIDTSGPECDSLNVLSNMDSGDINSVKLEAENDGNDFSNVDGKSRTPESSQIYTDGIASYENKYNVPVGRCSGTKRSRRRCKQLLNNQTESVGNDWEQQDFIQSSVCETGCPEGQGPAFAINAEMFCQDQQIMPSYWTETSPHSQTCRNEDIHNLYSAPHFDLIFSALRETYASSPSSTLSYTCVPSAQDNFCSYTSTCSNSTVETFTSAESIPPCSVSLTQTNEIGYLKSYNNNAMENARETHDFCEEWRNASSQVDKMQCFHQQNTNNVTSAQKTFSDVDSTTDNDLATPHKKKLKRGCRLWEFIRNLLLDPSTNPSMIRWENRYEGTFRIVRSKAIARMWGMKKGNEEMNYEKLSRAMRYYYKKKIFCPVIGQRLVYKFGPHATGWKE